MDASELDAQAAHDDRFERVTALERRCAMLKTWAEEETGKAMRAQEERDTIREACAAEVEAAGCSCGDKDEPEGEVVTLALRELPDRSRRQAAGDGAVILDYRRCEEMYRNDSTFCAIVQQMEALLERCDLTPADLRAAAMFVVTRHQMRHPPEVIIRRDEVDPVTWERLKGEVG